MNARDNLIEVWVSPKEASKLSILFARSIGHLADTPLEAIFESEFGKLKVKEIHNNELSTKIADVVSRNMKEYFAEEVKSEVSDSFQRGETVGLIQVKLQKKLQVFSELLQVAKQILQYEKPSVQTKEDFENRFKQFIQLTELALEPYLTREKRGLENLPSEVMKAFISFYHAVELKSEQVAEVYKKYEDRLDVLAEDNCFANWAGSADSVKRELNERINKLFSKDYNTYLRKIANTSVLNDFLLDKQFESATLRIEGLHSLLKDINTVIFSSESKDREVMQVLSHNLILKLTASCRNFIKDPFGEGQKIVAALSGSVDVLNEEIKKIRAEQQALIAEKQGICWACFMKSKITDLTKRINDKKQAAQKLLETVLDLQGLIKKYPQFETSKATPISELIKPPTKHRRDMSYSSMNLDALGAQAEAKQALKRMKSRRSMPSINMEGIIEEGDLPGKTNKGL